MVYTDGIHLIADTLDELHKFAKQIGLNKCWFENHRKPHYDLMLSTTSRKNMLVKATLAGAIHKTSRELVQILSKNE